MKPSVVIVGVGRVGGALAAALGRAGWDVSIRGRTASSRRRAATLGLRWADDEAMRAARLCFLAVPDDALPTVSSSVSASLGSRTALVHCSGASTLEVLGPEGAGPPARPRGSLHPLVAIASPRDTFEGCSAAIAADTPALERLLRRVARAAGMHPMAVPDEGRAAYHGGAVLCAGGLVALASLGVGALVKAGLGRAEATRALIPLMRSALDRIEARGLGEGMTGPVVRGDWGVVKRHRAALPKEAARVYRLLTEEMVRLRNG